MKCQRVSHDLEALLLRLSAIGIAIQWAAESFCTPKSNTGNHIPSQRRAKIRHGPDRASD
eukprot:1747587-Rhodomonas_salina.3